jgi:hypothetical protein
MGVFFMFKYNRKDGDIMNQFWQVVASNGVFALLFVWFLKDTMQKNETREIKYQDIIKENQDIISKLTDKFTVIETGICEIKEELKDIKIK